MDNEIMCWVIYFPKDKRFFHSYNTKKNIVLKSKSLESACFLFKESSLIVFDAALKQWGKEDFEFIKLTPVLVTGK
jgi:hypothetical protein